MTTRTAKRLEELKYMLLNGQIINEQGIFAEGEIQSIINFKNELKEIIEGKSSSERKIDRIRFLIQEIEREEKR